MKTVIRNYNRFLRKKDRYELQRGKMCKQIFEALELRQIPEDSQTPKFIESLSYRKDLTLHHIGGLYTMYLQNVGTWELFKITNVFMTFKFENFPTAVFIGGQEIDGNLFEQFMNLWGYDVVFKLVGRV